MREVSCRAEIEEEVKRTDEAKDDEDEHWLKAQVEEEGEMR